MSFSTVRSSFLLRRSKLFGVAALSALAVTAAPAAAYPIHVVVPGESLSSIAAANGMQIARLAAANGLSWNSFVTVGTELAVPPRDGLYQATTGQTMGYATSTTKVAASTGSTAATTTAASTASTATKTAATSSGSSHYVRPGDTLSTIAARLGTSIAQLAAANGISNYNLVISGTTLRSPGASTTVTPAPSAVPTSGTVTATGPEGKAAYTGSGASTTNERLSSSQIASIAAQHGVPGNLAAAIAWQESGNNNSMVSSTGARGVMQIMPGTWDWINKNLASPPLNPSSAADNVRAGSLLLKQLLKDTGGNESQAIAGYYQGLGSVRSRGLYDDTKQYVTNVQSLKTRVGG